MSSVANNYQAVPVDVARQIAELYRKSAVVILSLDPAKLVHTTTYGVTAADKEVAAIAGERCAKAIGADLRRKTTFEDFRNNFKAGLYREALELLDRVRAAETCDEPLRQRIDRLLQESRREESPDA